VRKSPLIGVSICAVVLLVLGSLTNVVGYQSVKSTVISDSPLFRTRTQRATNQQQNILTSQYLGMGKGTILQFPTRDNRNELPKNIFESIKKMNDATFQRFLILIKQRLKETTSLNEKQLREINDELTDLRKQADLPILSSNLIQLRNEFNMTPPTLLAHSLCEWSPGFCLIHIAFLIFGVIVEVVGTIILLIAFIIYLILNPDALNTARCKENQ
jgi:hypothetical protein